MSEEQAKEARASYSAAGLELRPEFEERLRQAVAYVASGGSLLSMEGLTSQLEDASDV
jgi:hypothetical protein